MMMMIIFIYTCTHTRMHVRTHTHTPHHTLQTVYSTILSGCNPCLTVGAALKRDDLVTFSWILPTMFWHSGGSGGLHHHFSQHIYNWANLVTYRMLFVHCSDWFVTPLCVLLHVWHYIYVVILLVDAYVAGWFFMWNVICIQ